MARHVGPEVTNARLLSPFCDLAADAVSGVRRACAQSLPAMSQMLRHTQASAKFAPIVRSLLDDSDRSVQRSAQRILGPFITSLVDPDLVPIDLAESFLALASATADDVGMLGGWSVVSSSIPLGSASGILNLPLDARNQKFIINGDLRPASVLATSRDLYGSDESQSASNPPASFAYSFGAVLWTVCGRGKEIFQFRKGKASWSISMWLENPFNDYTPTECRTPYPTPTSPPSSMSSAVPRPMASPVLSSEPCHDGTGSPCSTPCTAPGVRLPLSPSSTVISREPEGPNSSPMWRNVSSDSFSCSSKGGLQYWWPLFRKALLALLSDRENDNVGVATADFLPC